MSDRQQSEPSFTTVFHHYHPLGPHHPLYAYFVSSTKSVPRKGAVRGRPGPRDSRHVHLLSRYRPFAFAQNRVRNAAARVSIPAELDEDRRELTRYFDAFFQAFLTKTDPALQLQISQMPLVFPAVDLFDARCIEVDGRHAVFVTSRALDVVELFAHTLSMCMCLNEVALPTLHNLEENPPKFVPWAWLSLSDVTAYNILLGMLLDAMERRSEQDLEKSLREDIFNKGYEWLPDQVRRDLGDYQLSTYLSQTMVRAVNQLVRRDGGEGEDYLGGTFAPIPSRTPFSVDSQYLATLILTFIVLHETGHFVLRHNEPEPVEDWSTLIDAMRKTIEEQDLQGQFYDTSNTGFSYELAADAFALQVVNEAFREPLLEAATLWCAALASSNEGSADWLTSLGEAGESAFGIHPAFAMRVWYLNGRFSSGRRQGEIARDITRIAEAQGRQLGSDRHSAIAFAEVFRALWNIARHEIGSPNAVESLLPRLLRRLQGPWVAATFHRLLKGPAKSRTPDDLATMHLAYADAALLRGEQSGESDWLRSAIDSYRAALEIYRRDRQPHEWAAIHSNLGNALSELGKQEGNNRARFEEASVAYTLAQEVFTREETPLEWAAVQNNLGNLLTKLAEDDDTTSVKKAISLFKSSLEVRTRGKLPLDWAMTQSNLGAALQLLGEREQDPRLLEEAVIAQLAALEEWSRERTPVYWASAQNSLGNVLGSLGDLEEDPRRLQEAIVAYEAALEVRTSNAMPYFWAGTQQNLGWTFLRLGKMIDDTASLEKSVIAYRQALQVDWRVAAPMDWGFAQLNLGNALRMLGARKSDVVPVKESIVVLQEALQTFQSARNLQYVNTTLTNLETAKNTVAELA